MMGLLSSTLFLMLASGTAFASTLVVTVQGPETLNDTRYNYDREVIRLALDKTRDDYGNYILKETPIGQNSKRALTSAAMGAYENYVIKTSANNDLADNLAVVPFPVDLGIVGYRVAFVSESTKENLSGIETAEQLKQFSIVQGIGWLDSAILKYHGFDVRTIDSHNSMFKMVALNRVDLFTRGANELEAEWLTHKSTPNLTYDESLAIYYPLPRFLVTSKENEALAKRLHQGLLRAFADGSLFSLWEKNYRSSINFVNLEKRKIIRLSNPFISEIDPEWQQFVYTPAKAAGTNPPASPQSNSPAN